MAGGDESGGRAMLEARKMVEQRHLPAAGLRRGRERGRGGGTGVANFGRGKEGGLTGAIYAFQPADEIGRRHDGGNDEGYRALDPMVAGRE